MNRFSFYGFVGRLSKATFLHIPVHLYSSNVVTGDQTKLGNKQQNILNLCLLLTYIIVRRVYQVLGILQPTLVTRRFELSFAPRYTQPTVNKTRFFQSDQNAFLKANKPFFLKRTNRFFENETNRFYKSEPIRFC